MTSKTRITIEPRDILAIELECKNCSSRSIRPVTLALHSVDRCPNCSAAWPLQRANDLKQLEQLVSMISAVTKWENPKDIPFVVRFEIAEQKADGA